MMAQRTYSMRGMGSCCWVRGGDGEDVLEEFAEESDPEEKSHARQHV